MKMLRGYAQYLPFKDNVFDETVSAYCLYHIKIKPSKVISEMIRVTKPGGKIKIHPVHDIGFTDALNSEPSLFFFEVDEARTLVITKEQKCSHDYWQKLFDKLASSVAFREL